MDASPQIPALPKPQVGWSLALSLLGYALIATGVYLIRYGTEGFLGQTFPRTGLTVAQMLALPSVMVGTCLEGLLWMARRPPDQTWQLRIGPALAIVAVLTMGLRPATGTSPAGPAGLTLLLVICTRSFLALHAWLVTRGYVTFLPTPGSPLHGTAAYGPQVAQPASTLRSQYVEGIRQAAAQEERNRLARDLHDSIKQQIFAIHTSAATTQVRLDGDGNGAREAIDQIRSAARDAMTEMETMLDQLRAEPLEVGGLADALKKLCETTGFRTGSKVECNIGKLPPPETLAPGAAQATLRVAQEALANVAKHARASHVAVTLEEWGAWMTLTIEDDGVGFEESQAAKGMGGGMGMDNMRSRASELGGQLQVFANTKGQGTVVKLYVPAMLLSTPKSTIGWWMLPVSILIALNITRAFVDKQAQPDLARFILWSGEACILSLMVMMFLWAGRQAKRNKERAAGLTGTVEKR